MKVLFVTSTRIGDAVLSTGILRHLTDTYPHAEITIACGPVPAPLFSSVPGLQRVIVVRKKAFSSHWYDLWRATVGTRWDLVVDLRGSALAWLLSARRRCVLHPASGLVHRVRHVAGVLGLADPPAPKIWVDPSVCVQAEKLVPAGGVVLGVGPTANWGGKQWPIQRFAEAVARLTGPGGPFEGARVAVFCAPDERARSLPLIEALPEDRCIDLAGLIDLPTAYACLERCDFYLGNDSGLMHLAAASGTPTLGLFGPSQDELYAPWGQCCAVVRSDMSYEEIVNAKDFDWNRRESWMTSLSVDKVVAAVETLFQQMEKAAT